MSPLPPHHPTEIAINAMRAELDDDKPHDLYFVMIQRHAVRRALDEIDELRAIISELEGRANWADALTDVVGAIRGVLTDAGVPGAAFIDDHVANAVIERSRALSVLDRARAMLEGAKARGSLMCPAALLSVIELGQASA